MGQPINIEYTVSIWREGQDYIAHAMPLDVMSSGDPKEARQALQEAVSLFLTTALALYSARHSGGKRVWFSPWKLAQSGLAGH